MTPNVSEFLSVIGVSGPLTSSMIATARCFSHPNFKIQVFFSSILVQGHKIILVDTIPMHFGAYK